MFEDKKEATDNVETDLTIQPRRATINWDTELSSESEPSEQASQPANDSSVEKVGDIDLSVLDLPEQEQAQQETDEPELPSEPEYIQFAEGFKKYTGVDFQQALGLMQELQQFRAEQVVSQQRSELQSAWGISGSEFEERLSLVNERFARYDDNIRAQLNSPQGAQLIWAKIQQEQQQRTQKNVPALDRSNNKVTGGSDKYLYTRQQIAKMSNDEYSKEAGRIQYAYANGLVK